MAVLYLLLFQCGEQVFPDEVELGLHVVQHGCVDNNGVDLGHLLKDCLRIALREASRRHQQAALARLLILRHLKDGGNRRGMHYDGNATSDSRSLVPSRCFPV